MDLTPAFGGADAGRPIVCLHGLGRSASDWDRVRPGLERFGKVLTPTLPRAPADALDVADEQVSPGAIVIGHSIGGVLALRLARERPRPFSALILSDCFFPPARNGRGALASLRDYGAHRVAYLRALRTRSGVPSEASSRSGGLSALAGLIRLAVSRGEFEAAADAVDAPVLVVHARDDHHVPVDFALAAVARHADWEINVLDRGGHHAHVTRPSLWLESVATWLGNGAKERRDRP